MHTTTDHTYCDLVIRPCVRTLPVGLLSTFSHNCTQTSTTPWLIVDTVATPETLLGYLTTCWKTTLSLLATNSDAFSWSHSLCCSTQLCSVGVLGEYSSHRPNCTISIATPMPLRFFHHFWHHMEMTTEWHTACLARHAAWKQPCSPRLPSDFQMN